MRFHSPKDNEAFYGPRSKKPMTGLEYSFMSERDALVVMTYVLDFS
jgi:hypothetical protein